MNGSLGKAARWKLLAREYPLHLEWAVPIRADMATVEAHEVKIMPPVYVKPFVKLQPY